MPIVLTPTRMWRSSCQGFEATGACVMVDGLDGVHTAGLKSFVKGLVTRKPGYHGENHGKTMLSGYVQDQATLQKAAFKTRELQANQKSMLKKLKGLIDHASNYVENKQAKSMRNMIDNPCDNMLETSGPIAAASNALSKYLLNVSENINEERIRMRHWSSDLLMLNGLQFVTELMKNNVHEINNLINGFIKKVYKRHPSLATENIDAQQNVGGVGAGPPPNNTDSSGRGDAVGGLSVESQDSDDEDSDEEFFKSVEAKDQLAPRKTTNSSNLVPVEEDESDADSEWASNGSLPPRSEGNSLRNSTVSGRPDSMRRSSSRNVAAEEYGNPSSTQSSGSASSQRNGTVQRVQSFSGTPSSQQRNGTVQRVHSFSGTPSNTNSSQQRNGTVQRVQSFTPSNKLQGAGSVQSVKTVPPPANGGASKPSALNRFKNAMKRTVKRSARSRAAIPHGSWV
jgi:hypothetical protein